MSALFHWLSISDDEGDLSLSGIMKAVAVARGAFLICDESQEEECYEAYTSAKAWFMTKACRLLGEKVLAQGKDISSRMLDEGRRVCTDNQAHHSSIYHASTGLLCA
jgi:hypothetical protein